MMQHIQGLAVAKGIAVGRAVLVSSGRSDVAHYFIDAHEVEHEVARLKVARKAVMTELQTLQREMPKDAPPELDALLDVHLMLLADSALSDGVKEWIVQRKYNAEWALSSQLDVLARQFDEMEDAYLRERKADLEQLVERVLTHLQAAQKGLQTASTLEVSSSDEPLIMVARDISPADMLQFKKSVFQGFVTDVGGKTSHTAIVARSMEIPAVVGTKHGSQLIAQDDWLIVDGDAGLVITNPTPEVLQTYRNKQKQALAEHELLYRLRHTPAQTRDGLRIELMANIELPQDTHAAIDVGAVGVGLFRSEFLFMGRQGLLPGEEEQYQAYKKALEGMHGLPVTIRTIDIGADKPLDHEAGAPAHLNPALGLRAIRWSLAEPDMFRTQLRAILRAAAHGKVRLLIPMVAQAREIHRTLDALSQARRELDAQGIVYGAVQLGAMIEVPAAALCMPMLIKYFDFFSIGTNDLIQYTLAIDRADESVAHLYDPLHPAVLQLMAQTIAQANAAGKSVSVCGEMAGDVQMTRLLLGMGLRSFSMHPSQMLAVKQEILRTDVSELGAWTEAVLSAEEPMSLLQEKV